MVYKGFWEKLEKPIIGLAPMDGVTDAAFRHMICKYSSPSVVITEFTNVEGLARGAISMLKSFIYSEVERPIVAQIFGVEEDSYYKVALMMCALGFDGIDINMGCPVNKVAKHGSGAGLIKTPDLAKRLVLTVKRAMKDWSEGIELCSAGVDEGVLVEIARMNGERTVERRMLPVSVKTRIGYDTVVVEEWMKHLLEVGPASICLHGRTLRQLYRGDADWEAIGRACAVVRESGLGVNFLGNGDVASMEEAKMRVRDYGVDGVLVGRATFGDPWFFGGTEPTMEERFKVMLEHAEYFAELNYAPFHNIRKHLAWYCKGFDGAKELRMRLMKVENVADVRGIVYS